MTLLRENHLDTVVKIGFTYVWNGRGAEEDYLLFLYESNRKN